LRGLAEEPEFISVEARNSHVELPTSPSG